MNDYGQSGGDGGINNNETVENASERNILSLFIITDAQKHR